MCPNSASSYNSIKTCITHFSSEDKNPLSNQSTNDLLIFYFILTVKYDL